MIIGVSAPVYSADLHCVIRRQIDEAWILCILCLTSREWQEAPNFGKAHSSLSGLALFSLTMLSKKGDSIAEQGDNISDTALGRICPPVLDVWPNVEAEHPCFTSRSAGLFLCKPAHYTQPTVQK